MTAATDYPIPRWQVTLEGQDLTQRIAPRLIDLTLTEERGGAADQLDLRIQDHDGAMALPRRGVELAVAFGWAEGGLINKGRFIVDEVEHSGSPDMLTIRARSADLTHPFRTRRERSWHDTTLGAVLRNLAGEHGLQPKLDATLANITLEHLDEAGESDAALLTRLGQRFDAVATVKAGSLLFVPIGSGTTSSGLTLPHARIERAAGDQHRYSVVDRDTYSGVKAYWHDKTMARRKSVLVGSQDNAKTLQGTFGSQAEAQQHADASWKRVQRGGGSLSYTLALGRADLYPEQPVTVVGFKPEIDGNQWLIAKCTHAVTGTGGFTTALELELGNS